LDDSPSAVRTPVKDDGSRRAQGRGRAFMRFRVRQSGCSISPLYGPSPMEWTSGVRLVAQGTLKSTSLRESGRPCRTGTATTGRARRSSPRRNPLPFSTIEPACLARRSAKSIYCGVERNVNGDSRSRNGRNSPTSGTRPVQHAHGERAARGLDDRLRAPSDRRPRSVALALVLATLSAWIGTTRRR
jgi:hypothetical protein